MTEVIVSIFVVAIIILVHYRYATVFCLPFFWAALFAFIYVGLLRIHAQSGGSSYLYAAEGFGMFFLGLLGADFLFFYRPGAARIRSQGRHANSNSAEAKSKPSKQAKATRIRLLFPVLPLNVGLFVSLLAATFVTIIFLASQGFPILSSFPALAWVQSTSGVVNRLMTVFGPGCYASLALMAWAVHRETGSRAAKGLMYLGLALAIIGQGLLATKSAAIMVFVWFNILLYYMNKKRDLLKTLIPLIIVVVPVSAAIVAVRMMSTQGYWQTEGIYKTYYDRLTSVAAEPLDFTFKYMNRFGPIHSQGFRLEVRRIKEQLTGEPKTPVLSELVFNLLNGMPQDSTGLSASLTLQGTGYIEWGMAGLLLYSFLQGLGFGLIHWYLLRQETMNLIVLIFVGAMLSYLIGSSVSGVILVGFETVFLDAIPPLAVLLPFCVFFLLPLARRYCIRVDRRVSSPQQT